jgi:hypothetical protein
VRFGHGGFTSIDVPLGGSYKFYKQLSVGDFHRIYRGRSLL